MPMMTKAVLRMSPRPSPLPDARPVLVTGAAGFIGYHVAEALFA